MAAIEELVQSISDPELRNRIAAEVAKLKAGKTFGLVFEEHVPEIARLPSLPVKPGVRAVKKTGPPTALFRVIGDVDGNVRIAAQGGGTEEVVERSSLVVAKALGEPMYPALVPVDAVERAPDKPWHVLINADNYHALQLLLYGYEGRVDAIYIDPPYNSGARHWRYNNAYVDQKDAYRHSKWLSMMERRLKLAKRLLRDDGVLICTIDENEVGHLSVLLEATFPKHLRHMVSAVINPKGTGKLNFARVDEYIFFCVPDIGHSIIRGVPTALGKTTSPGEGALFYPSAPVTGLFSDLANEEGARDDTADAEEGEAEGGGTEQDDRDEDNGDDADSPVNSDTGDTDVDPLPFPTEELPEWELRHARRRGSESSYRHQRWNQFYPIFIDERARRVARAGDSIPLGQSPSFRKEEGLTPIWPIDKEGNERCWRFVSSEMQKLIVAGRVRLGRYNAEQKSWTLNIWERKPESKKLKTVWWKRAHDAGTHGTTLLHQVLGRRAAFPFPKSIYAVADALAAVIRTRPEAVVLDFFAGSGTTLHATCMLNAVYGGKRRCIAVTNNEVGEKAAKSLAKRGAEPGSREYEEHGIAEAVAWPRIKAIVAGRRPDGRKLTGTYLDGRPMADGFSENAAFFKLNFLDPAEVSRGDKFESIIPILWMVAGCVGPCTLVRGAAPWFMPEKSPFAVLIREDRFNDFGKRLHERANISHVFLVTDSAEAFAEMAAALGGKYRCVQLYKSYLDTFKINLTDPAGLKEAGRAV